MIGRTLPNWIFTGGSGRVGQLVLRHWAIAPPAAQVHIQTRRQDLARHSGHFVWDPLTAPLPAHLEGADCLIAFAGITPSSGLPLETNTELAQATCAAALAAGVRRVLLTSSSAVYGARQDLIPFHEDEPLHPVNAYGLAKAQMEDACEDWRSRGLDLCCLRIGNVAGADVLLLNGQTASGDNPLKLDRFADGNGPCRSYIGPGSLARVVAALAAYPARLPRVLNISAPRPVSMAQLANAANIPWEWVPAPDSSYQNILLDVKTLERLVPLLASDSDPQEIVAQYIATRDR